jgi:hypothetical protein
MAKYMIEIDDAAPSAGFIERADGSRTIGPCIVLVHADATFAWDAARGAMHIEKCTFLAGAPVRQDKYDLIRDPERATTSTRDG